MAYNEFLVIGDGMIDQYTMVETNRKSPEDSNIDVWDVLFGSFQPGGAFNVAANLASIENCRVDYSGMVPADDSQLCLKDYNIVKAPCLTEKTSNMLVKHRFINYRGKKQLFRIDNLKKFCHYEVEGLSGKYSTLDRMPFKYDLIIVSDYNKGTITPEIIEALNKATVPVLIDTKFHDLSIWDGVPDCIFKINALECSKVTNAQNKKIVVTQGSNGAVLLENYKETFKVKGKPIEEASVIGAGDAYLAGLASGYLAYDHNIRQAMLYADAVARASVRKEGTSIVRGVELAHELLNEREAV